MTKNTTSAPKKKAERPLPESLGLPLCGVETHCHLDYKYLEKTAQSEASTDTASKTLAEPPANTPAHTPGQTSAHILAESLAQTLDRAAQAGIARLGNVFMGLAAYRNNAHFMRRHPQVFFLLGIHPNDAAETALSDVADMAGLFAADLNLKAVGETGLDFYWERTPREVQERFFQEQLALARELGKPVVVHSREAFAETLHILDGFGLAGEQVLWHCFGGGPDQAEELLRRGYTVSIPGPVTYPKNAELRRAVAGMDLSRLVLESDAPFLTPEPYRGRPNEPAYNVFTAAAVAQALGLSAGEVWRKTAENAARFFAL